MSWWDDVKGAVGGVVDWFGEHKVASSILSTVVTGYALNKVQESIASGTEKQAATVSKDAGVILTFPVNQENKIPVIYGNAVTNGVLSEAVMSEDRRKMYYVITLCEKTGTIRSTGVDSKVTIEEVFWGKNKIAFSSAGIIQFIVDDNSVVDNNPFGLVQVLCYNDGSSSGTGCGSSGTGGASPSGAPSVPASTAVLNWTAQHTMDHLVFAVVIVEYSREKGITGLPPLTFKLKNTLTQPGDVIYDYMTNTRYGAGIDPASIDY
jgi:hypothetical protein